jgi:hypothetical protein
MDAMRFRSLLLVLCFCILTAPIIWTAAVEASEPAAPASEVAAPASEPAVRAAGVHRPAAAKGTVIVPDTFLRRWDPVTVFFSGDAGPATGGPEDHPDRFVTFSPSHPGAFQWLDARTLQFRPASPWPPLARVTVRVEGARATLHTLMSAPISTIPSDGDESLASVELITLTFPEAVDVEALARMISIELRPLPGIDRAQARWRRAEDFQVKALEHSGPEAPATYVLDLAQPIPLETRAIVHLRLSLDDDPQRSFTEFGFRTAEPFRIVALGPSWNRYPITPNGTRYTREQAMAGDGDTQQLLIEFNAEPSAFGPALGRNLVRFTPSVANLSFQLSRKILEVTGDFSPETVYRATIVPTPVTDRKGRALELHGESELYFYFPSQPSYLRWGRRAGIVERYGPQMVPIEGRDDDRVDLRMYKIDPLDRSFWPFPGLGNRRDEADGESEGGGGERWERYRPRNGMGSRGRSRHTPPFYGSMIVDESPAPPGPGEEPEPFDDMPGPIPPHELLRRIAALGTPLVSRIVDLPLHRRGRAADFGLDLAPHLTMASGKGASGTYLVGIRRLNGDTTREWMRVQVTDLSLTTVEEPKGVRYVVTSLSTGRPVVGARVALDGLARPGTITTDTSMDGRDVQVEGSLGWTTLADGVTDEKGLYLWEPPSTFALRDVSMRRIVVRTSDDQLILDPDDAPDTYTDNQWSPSDGAWLAWAGETLEERGPQPDTLCHLFTERPVYRPDEKVHLKGYLRRREKGSLSILPMDAFLVIEGPGSLKWRYPVTLSPQGSFYHPFAQEKLPTGDYTARLVDIKEKTYATVGFKLDAYRLPEFEVQLHAPDRIPLDHEAEVRLTATYYAGGRVADRPVQWRVTQFPYPWSPEGRPGFLFSSDGRFSGIGRFQSTPRQERQDRTDDGGTATLVVNPAIEPTAQPRTYVVEATVTGPDDQTVTSMRRVVALPPFVLGLKVPRYIEHARSIDPQILVLDHAGKPLAGLPVTVRLLHRQWHSVLRESDFSSGEARYLTDVVDVKVMEKKIESAADAVTLSLPVEKAGVYIVELEAHDRLGRALVVSVDLYAGGDEPVAWPKPSTPVFSVASDKPAYDPGETAALVLESPFREGEALVIVEGPEGNEVQWIPIRNGAATFHLPILGVYTPRVPVHFVLMRGRPSGSVPQAGSTTDLGKPTTMASTAWIKVNPFDNRTEVRISAPEKGRPGEKIDIKIRLSDPAGKPLPGEVTLWLVDAAVLALGKEQRLDPVPDFITEVSSHLSLHDTRNSAFGYLPFAERPGGGAGAEEEEILDRATIRKLFQSVPYYNPEIMVGDDGMATVTVELPDNLTNFKIRAKVASGAQRFGFGTGVIAVRLPLIVQPALPRFLRPGDRFVAAAFGRVVEGEGGPGSAQIQVQGVTLTGETRRSLTFVPNQPERIAFEVLVPTPTYTATQAATYAATHTADGQPSLTEATFRVGVSRDSDGATDAFEVKLPIREDRSPITTRALADLSKDAPWAFPAIAEPARPGTVRRSVFVCGQPALVRMAAGLQYLLEYPYGCTEQRISRARAGVATKQLRTLLHQDASQESIDGIVRETLEWIPSAMDRDGLVAYWPGSPGYVSLTAWTMQFLVEAKDAGYAVSDDLLATLTRSLTQSLRSDYARFIDGEAYAERSWALVALTAAGKFEPSYAAELARRSEFLDLESTAKVVQAFAQGGQADAPVLPALAERLSQGVVTRLYQGREIYGGLQEARTSSGLILPSETRTIAELVRALAATPGTHPRLQLLTDALVTLGRDDGWGSTQANAAALLALAGLYKPPFSGAAPASIALRAGAEEGMIQLGPDTPAGTWSTTSVEAGEIQWKEGDGPVIARVETSYLPAADGSRASARAVGFAVTREILLVGAEGEAAQRLKIDAPGKLYTFRVGDVIEDHVQVVNADNRNFVAVVVPLAAGMEVLNPRLATAPPEARPRGRITQPPTYASYLDDQVCFYYDVLPTGTYDFYFRMRATVEGRFMQPPARAEMMYDLGVSGCSPGAAIEVERRP